VIAAGTDAECDLLTLAAMSDRYHPICEHRFRQSRAVLMMHNNSLAIHDPR
jgi:hypothetical protein